MKRARGFTLLEVMVYSVLVLALIGFGGQALIGFLESHERIQATGADLATASRFLVDVKADLRRASRVAVAAGRLELEFPGGEAAVYEAREDGAARTGDGPAREYAGAAVTFGEGEARTVTVEVEIANRDPHSAFRPRWRARVFCRNRGE